jgi:hypothetical protein
MSQLKRAGRFLRSLATAADLAELRATVEASSEAQLEAVSFLTRSINEFSTRLEKLERVGDDTEG